MKKFILMTSLLVSCLGLEAANAQTSSTAEDNKSDSMKTSVHEVQKSSLTKDRPVDEDHDETPTFTDRGHPTLAEPFKLSLARTGEAAALLCRVGKDDSCPDGMVCMQMDSGGTQCLTPPELKTPSENETTVVKTTR